jgi:hypothetical protein
LDTPLYTWPSIYARKEIQLKFQLQHTETWSASAWPFCRQCYRPAIFIRHLRLIALSFPYGKIWRAFYKLHYFNFVFTIFKIAYGWKSRNLKLLSRGVAVDTNTSESYKNERIWRV